MVSLGDCRHLLENRSKFEAADACNLGARALYGVPHTNVLHEILSRHLLQWNSVLLSCCTSTPYYPGILATSCMDLSAGEIGTAESAPHTTSYHCGFNMGMDKSRVSGVQSTSLTYQGQR